MLWSAPPPPPRPGGRPPSPTPPPPPGRATAPRRRGGAAQATRAQYGDRIDILVNVAGGSGPIGKTGVETSEDEFDDIIALNMRGCFNAMRAVLPAMMAQRYGKIVNVG